MPQQLVPLDGQVYGHPTFQKNCQNMEVNCPVTGRWGIPLSECADSDDIAPSQLVQGWADVIAEKMLNKPWHEALSAFRTAFRMIHEGNEGVLRDVD